MDISKARSRVEFNKRVRDLVSRDNNQLKTKCDKIDKQCADRMAEIHHMKEKVRHSMRSLEYDRLMVQKKTGIRKDSDRHSGAPLRKISGAPSILLGGASTGKPTGSSPDSSRKDLLGSSQKHPKASKDVSKCQVSDSRTSKFRRASAPITIPGQTNPHDHRKRDDKSKRKTSKNDDFHEGNSLQKARSPSKYTLDIPGSDFTKRRSSSPLSLSQPGSPNLRDTRTGFSGLALSSSFPNELCNSKTTRKLSKSFEPIILSVDNMRMSTASPKVYIHRKCTDESSSFRDKRKHSETLRQIHDFSPIGSRVDSRENRPRSVSLAHVASSHVTKQSTRKLSGAGPKGQLFRTRSSSLPDLLGPEYPKRLGNQMESLKISSPKCLSVEDKSLIHQSQLSRSFEQLKHCRYLRSKEQDNDVTS